jgi:hypothetical protein
LSLILYAGSAGCFALIVVAGNVWAAVGLLLVQMVLAAGAVAYAGAGR